MDVSENRGTPKSSILIGVSSIIHFGVPLFLETPIFSTQLRPGPNSTTTKKIHTHHTRTVRPMGCRLKLVQHIFGFSQFGHFSLWWESWGGSGAPPIRKNVAIQMILFFHCHVGLREGIFPKPELFGHFGGRFPDLKTTIWGDRPAVWLLLCTRKIIYVYTYRTTHMYLQGRPLPVMNGGISPINGLING